MNKLLAGSVRFLNAALAMIIIAFGIGTALAILIDPSILPASSHLWAVFVAIAAIGISLLVATIFCGLLALLVDMRSELIKMRTLLEQERERTRRSS